MLCMMHVQKVLANAENTETIDEHLWVLWGGGVSFSEMKTYITMGI